MTNQPPGAVSPAKEPVRVFEGVVKQVRRPENHARHVFLRYRCGHRGHHDTYDLYSSQTLATGLAKAVCRVCSRDLPVMISDENLTRRLGVILSVADRNSLSNIRPIRLLH